MNRIPNWDIWLIRFAEGAVGHEYKIGKTDCVTLVRRALTQMLGKDPWKGKLKSWKTTAGALKVARDIDPMAFLEATGAQEIQKNFVSGGDVACIREINDEGFPSVALVLNGRKALISSPEAGVEIVDRLNLPDETRYFRYG